MSSVVISGNTSGAITLSAPDVAGTNTITLPASTGYLFVTPTAGTLGVSSGGTGQTTASAAFNALSPITTAGDLIIGNGSNSATRLAIGSNNQVLTSNGTTATWASAAAGGFSSMQVFTSPGTFTTPASTTKIKVTVTGGGGGGAYNLGGGGGGGGSAIYVGPVSASTGYAVTVGSGGSSPNYQPGNSGNTSSFGALASATGGGGGQVSPSAFGGTAGAGGAGTAGTLLLTGGAGINSMMTSAPSFRSAGFGGSTFWTGLSYFSVGGNYGGGGSSQTPGPANGYAGASGVVVVEY